MRGESYWQYFSFHPFGSQLSCFIQIKGGELLKYESQNLLLFALIWIFENLKINYILKHVSTLDEHF